MDSPEQLRAILMEATLASLREFRLDLERRIAVVLYMKLPQATVVNIAQEVSGQIGAYIDSQVVESKALERAMDKLL